MTAKRCAVDARSGSIGATIVLNDNARISDNTVTDGTGGGINGDSGGSGGGISLFSGALNACDSTLDEWVGAISLNTPDDPPAPTLVACT